MNARHAALLAVLSVACGGHAPTAPQRATPPQVVQPAPPGGQPTSESALVGLWRGSSTVESTGGILPECIAPAWRGSFTDAISAEIQPYQDGATLNLYVRQPASEDCHLKVASQSPVTAGPWPFDEFDCAILPSLCYPSCHFRVKSSEWGCVGMPPDVWILGINLTGTFADASQSRIHGTLEVAYDHRPGDSPANGRYRTATVTKRFEIVKER